MDRMQKQVALFHRAMGLPAPLSPREVWPDAERFLRAKLILEEALETVNALGFDVLVDDGDPVAVGTVTLVPALVVDHLEAIDGLCDIVYVALGAAVQFGVDLAPHFDAVQTANLMKLGGEVREDGKRLKPEGWQPPNHGPILEAQKA